MARTGDWFQTFTGRQFYLTDPHPDDVCIEDIGHALSMTCRFGGHTRNYYSVAQHSVHCSQYVGELHGDDSRIQLYALLHDASEAYLGDVVRPLKYAMPNYRVFEDRMTEVIYQGLKVIPPTTKETKTVKTADDVLLMTERRDFITHRNIPWSIIAQPWHYTLPSLTPRQAEIFFLARYERLRKKVASTRL